MKKFILITVLVWLDMAVYAQLPDWIMSKPVSSNYTMDYEVGIGEGDTYKQAQNEAYIEVLKKLISRCRLSVSSEAIIQAVYAGKSLTTINKDFVLPPIREVCSHSIRLSNGKTRVYLLYQVPRDGSIISPQYENFSDCYTFDMTTRRSNIRSVVASSFIPGTGQMLKGHAGSGAAFLVTEVALFGGGTVCYFLSQEQLKIMKATGTSYADYQSAKKSKRRIDIAMFTCYGVGAAVHIGNMIHAWYATDKKLPSNISFVPAIIPTNEYSMPSYAMGAGMQIKF